jgi:hypothetical protein
MADSGHNHAGLAGLLGQPLIETIFRRRTHRVSRGARLEAGSMSYEPDNPPCPPEHRAEPRPSIDSNWPDPPPNPGPTRFSL